MFNFDETISRLRSISEKVCTYLDTQLYLVDKDEDTIDRHYITNECYGIVVDELAEIGIIFHCMSEELYNNFYDMENIATLRNHFSVPKLYEWIISDASIKSKVLELCESDNLSVELLKLKAETSHDEEISRAYEFLWDKITNDSRLVNYVEGVCDLHEDSTIPDLQEDYAELIISSVAKGRESATVVISLAMELDDTLDKVRLAHDLDLYDLDKLQPGNINKYGWRASVDKDTLSEPEQALHDKYKIEHNINNNHHVEYYEAKDSMTISKEDAINLLTNRYDESDSKGMITDEMNKIYARLEKKHVVPDKVKTFIDLLISKLQVAVG